MLAIVALCALTWLSAVAPAMTETADMKPGREVGFDDKLADTYAEAVDFHYTHLWTSKNGTTQFAECHMKGFKSQVYAEGTPPLSEHVPLPPPRLPCCICCDVYQSKSIVAVTGMRMQKILVCSGEVSDPSPKNAELCSGALTSR